MAEVPASWGLWSITWMLVSLKSRVPRELSAVCFALLEDCTWKNDVIRCLISASVFFIIECSWIWVFLCQKDERILLSKSGTVLVSKRKSLSSSKFTVLVTLKGNTLFRSGSFRFAVKREVFDAFNMVTRDRGEGATPSGDQVYYLYPLPPGNR